MSDSSRSVSPVERLRLWTRGWGTPATAMPVTALVRLVADAGHPTAEISLIDANFAMVAQGVGVLDTLVPHGLYEIQYKAGRTVHEVSVRVPAGAAEHHVDVPRLTTRTVAVPAPDADGQLTAEWVAQASRTIHVTAGAGAQLFICARLVGAKDAATHDGVFDLELRNSQGARVVRFEDTAVGRDDSLRGCTIALSPGTYILSAAAGSLGRIEQAIHVAGGWQTQMLLTPTDYGPERFSGADLRRASVLMSQLGTGCDLRDPAVGWVEAARVALFGRNAAAPASELRRAVNAVKEARGSAAGDPSPATWVVDQLLASKFTNPMLGILGGHLLLLHEPIDRDLLAEVVTNLERLIPGHPDVQALRYPAGIGGEAEFVDPPMLRSSWQLIVDQSIDQPQIVPGDSLAARIGTRTWGGGAWLLWKGADESVVAEASGPARAAAQAVTPPLRRASAPSALTADQTSEQMQELLATLEKTLPRHDVNRYVRLLAGRLGLGMAETKLLQYLAGVAQQSEFTTDLLSSLPSSLTERLYRAAYGLWTGRYLPDATQLRAWVAEARGHHLREAAVVRALGVPKSALSASVEQLSTLLKGNLLMTPKVCFDRILPNDLDKVRPASPIPGARTRAAFEIAKLWDVGTTLRVRFMGGTPAQHDIVKKFAPEWSKHANIRFAFGNDQTAEIRIAFVETDGAWSYIGTDCSSIPITQPTMNLGWQDEGVVLHEFGHTLGLIHEHQNPIGGIQWNKPAVYADLSGSPNFWDKKTIDNNMFATYDHDQINGTSLDVQSIMLYEIPMSWTTNRFSSKANEKLSDVDKKFAHNQCNYPFTGLRKQPCS